MIEPSKLKPFKRFCMTIGELPSSYMESMTYYEMLEWLCNYLEKTVVPAVNNNANALTELQNYVNNYFENLDVQNEINNKLDEMAESGELAEIIAQYVNLQSVLAFDTLADLKSAENLVAGSITRTCGNVTYNDGKGAFYKVRQLTSGDTIDEINIIALTNYPTLIAELLPNYYINTLNTEVGNINTEITGIKNNYVKKTNKFIVLGDSWSDPDYSEWAQYFATNNNLQCINYAKSGAGFVQPSINLISTQLTEFLEDEIPEEEISYIIVLGGLNDYTNSVTNIDLQAGVNSILHSLRTNYPNTRILYVSNCTYPYSKEQMEYWYNLHNGILEFPTLNLMNKIGYLLYSNLGHLTQVGQWWLAKNIDSCLNGGELMDYIDEREFSNEYARVLYKTIPVSNDCVMIDIQIKILADFTSTTVPATYVNYGGETDVIGAIGYGFKKVITNTSASSIIIATDQTATAGESYRLTYILTASSI